MNLIPPSTKVVTGFTIISGGINYVSPTISIDGGGGIGASVEATVVGGKITTVNIINQGSGFATPPTVTIEDDTGEGAIIEAIIGDPPYKNKLEFLIQEQLPEFVQNEYSGFVTFLEGYYRYLDQSGQVNNFLLNAKDYSDVDTTLEQFIEQFRSQYAVDIPQNVLVNQRRLVKLIRDFYESKGAEDSIELLFKILYDETVEFFYPSTHILRASDGVWIEDVIIRIVEGSTEFDPFTLSGKICNLVYYENTGVQIFPKTIETTVTGVKKLAYTVPAIYELNVSLPKNSPLKVPGAGAVATLNITDGSITSVDVVDGGSGYYAAPEIILQNTNGTGAVLRANIVDGAVDTITVLQGGSGYIENDDANEEEGIDVVFSTDSIRTKIYLASNSTDVYGYVIRQLSTVEVISCDGDGIDDDCGFRVGQIYQIDEQSVVGIYVIDPPMSPVSEGLIDAIEADPADYGTYDENRFNDGINDPFFVAGDGYTSGSRDNRASIRISSIDEGGCVTAVTIFNTGFDFAQEEFQATITSPNGCEAVLAFTTGAVLVKAGRFKDSRGMLSNINKLQDNYYYQNYSYVIKSGITSGSWLPIINKTVHPAGMAVFGELLITQTIDMVDYIGVLDVLVLNEFFVDVVLMNDQSRSVDFHKILTDIVAGTVTTYAVPDYVPIEYASMNADSLEVHFYKVLSDSVVLSDATELLFDVGIYDSEEDTTSTIDSFDRVVQYVRQFNEAFYTSHTTTVDFGKTVVEDPVWVTRDFWATPDYSGTEFAWNAEETVNVDFRKYLSDAYTLSDSVGVLFEKQLYDPAADATSLNDSLERVVQYVRQFNEDTSLNDSFDRVVQYVRQFNDSFYTSHTTEVDFGKTIVEDPVWINRKFWATPEYNGTEFAWDSGDTTAVAFDKNVTDSYSASDFNNLAVGKGVLDTATTSHGRPGFVINKVLSETIFASDAIAQFAKQHLLTDSFSVSEDSIISNLVNKTEIATTLDYYNKVLQISKTDGAETSEIIFIEDDIPQIDLVGVVESSRLIINKGIGDMLGISDSGIINTQDYVDGDFGSDFVGQATYF
jgi:sulfur relay (sulfurtransferase) DsrC/TusE family protein